MNPAEDADPCKTTSADDSKCHINETAPGHGTRKKNPLKRKLIGSTGGGVTLDNDPGKSASTTDGGNGGGKPSYCSSSLYKIGNDIGSFGSKMQDVGAGFTLGGAALSAAGPEALPVSGAIMSAGVQTYSVGVYLSLLSQGFKTLAGQPLSVTGANVLLRIPTLPLPNRAIKPLVQMAGGTALNEFEASDKSLNPCE